MSLDLAMWINPPLTRREVSESIGKQNCIGGNEVRGSRKTADR